MSFPLRKMSTAAGAPMRKMSTAAGAPMRKMSTAGPNELLVAQIHNRRANDRAIIENPLAYFTDAELEMDVQNFTQTYLPSVPYAKVLRAARVAKDIRLYDEVARSDSMGMGLLVHLTDEERRCLVRERDRVFSERGMRKVILTVSLAALLQGFVQSSFNGASFYRDQWGLDGEDTEVTWRLGGTNAAAWFAAALVGCPLSLPINYYYGRRGGLIAASILIFISSVAAIFAQSWGALLGIRIINGLGMGIKAVSTPILASETAVGFWRGTAILAWQLWVAFGIMMGFAFNLLFTTAPSDRITLGLIQGAPLVPALMLFTMALFVCPESPRYHLQKGPNYSPEKAYNILRQLRNTELQALRDMYAVHKSIEQESMGAMSQDPRANLSPGFWWTIWDFCLAFKQLFQQRRLYNALISAGTVNLAQQLSGVNVFAFYSTELVGNVSGGDSMDNKLTPMAYSLGFGAINFLFALPAVRSIDTLGRRRWLLMTLPFMSLSMLGGALAYEIPDASLRTGIVALFLYLFAVAYSPGLGPIPFTLASESFPLSHREAGTAWPISINLFFAGLVSMLYPSIRDTETGLGDGGSLGLFAGLNIIAFILVFFLVEETKGRSLEDLDLVFAVSKRRFMSFQVQEYLPWFIKRYLFGKDVPPPELYHDYIWGPWKRMSNEESPRQPFPGQGPTTGGGFGYNMGMETGSCERVAPEAPPLNPPPVAQHWEGTGPAKMPVTPPGFK